MVEISESLRNIQKTFGDNFPDEIAYMFDYVNSTDQFNLKKVRPWHNELAQFFKSNLASWTSSNFTSLKWRPINEEPRMRQTVFYLHEL